MNDGTLIKLRKPVLYFDNITIENSSQCESLIHSIESQLEKLKGEFLALVMSTPKDISPKGEDPISYIKEKVNDLLDNIYEAYNDYFTATLIRNILYEWEYTYSEDSKDIYNNDKVNENIDKYAFPKDEHIEIKRDLTKFSFAPPDDKITDCIVRGVQNIKLNDEISDFISDKYIIIENRKVYTEYDGQCLFKTYEDAEKILKTKFDIHTIDYISKEFVNNHPKFFDSVISLMKENNFDNDFIVKFKSAVIEFINTDCNFINNQEVFETIYNGLNKITYDELYKLCDIKIIKLSELIKKVNE